MTGSYESDHSDDSLRPYPVVTIGLGQWASKSDELTHHERFRRIGAADIVPEADKQQELTTLGIPHYWQLTDQQALELREGIVRDLENDRGRVVSIKSPNLVHEPQIINAMNHGAAYVWVEKFPGVDRDSYHNVLDYAAESKVPFGINLHYLGKEPTRWLHEYSGSLSELYGDIVGLEAVMTEPFYESDLDREHVFHEDNLGINGDLLHVFEVPVCAANISFDQVTHLEHDVTDTRYFSEDQKPTIIYSEHSISGLGGADHVADHAYARVLRGKGVADEMATKEFRIHFEDASIDLIYPSSGDEARGHYGEIIRRDVDGQIRAHGQLSGRSSSVNCVDYLEQDLDPDAERPDIWRNIPDIYPVVHDVHEEIDYAQPRAPGRVLEAVKVGSMPVLT